MAQPGDAAFRQINLTTCFFSIGRKVGYVSATDGYPGASACLSNPALNISCGRYYRDLGSLSTKVSPVITVDHT